MKREDLVALIEHLPDEALDDCHLLLSRHLSRLQFEDKLAPSSQDFGTTIISVQNVAMVNLRASRQFVAQYEFSQLVYTAFCQLIQGNVSLFKSPLLEGETPELALARAPEHAKLRWLLITNSLNDWALGFTLCSCGLASAGNMLLRRTIECICYASVISDSDKLAKLWSDRTPGLPSSAYRNKFSIPLQYKHRRFEQLWPLIGLYDHFSEIAVHANLGIFGFKTTTSNGARSKFGLSVFDDPDSIGGNVTLAAFVGLWSLRSAANALRDLLLAPDLMDKNLELIASKASMLLPENGPTLADLEDKATCAYRDWVARLKESARESNQQQKTAGEEDNL